MTQKSELFNLDEMKRRLAEIELHDAGLIPRATPPSQCGAVRWPGVPLPSRIEIARRIAFLLDQSGQPRHIQPSKGSS